MDNVNLSGRLTSLPHFRNRRVLVIGDTIIDETVKVEPLGLSLETPTIVCKRGAVSEVAGGAALVARNLQALGVTTQFVTLEGADRWWSRRPQEKGGLIPVVVTDKGRPTPRKTRFWGGNYKLFQLDDLVNDDVSDEVQWRFTEAVTPRIDRVDAIVVADYRHGFLTKVLSRWIVEACRLANKPVFVASQMSHREGNHENYSGAAAFVLNHKEALSCGADPNFWTETENTIDEYGNIDRGWAGLEVIRRRLKTENLVVTHGEHGAQAAFGFKRLYSAARKIEAVDVCGAGDAFLAGLVAVGDMGTEALEFATAWAAAACMVRGSSPPVLARADEEASAKVTVR